MVRLRYDGSADWWTRTRWSVYASVSSPIKQEYQGLPWYIVPLKDQKGVTMRRIPCSGSWNSGATFIDLEDVVVPVENLIGKEGMGMKYIMTSKRAVIAALKLLSMWQTSIMNGCKSLFRRPDLVDSLSLLPSNMLCSEKRLARL